MTLENFKNIPFHMQDLSSVYPECANLAMKAGRLEKSGQIIRLKRGLYVANPLIGRQELSAFLLANHIYGPSYVSMHAALRHYGLIPEAVYRIQSMTTGVSRTFRNSIATFTYTHVPAEYYRIGITIATENDTSFLMASPEKALCDLMVYTPNLNLRHRSAVMEYLQENLRFEMDSLADFNPDIIRECIKTSRKKTMLNHLISIIKHERDI